MSIFLGLGANLGNREANLRMALRWLARECDVVAVSSLYRSEAIVLEGAQPGPGYLNAVCEIATALDPAGLLRFAKGIEYEMGRRPAPRWSPRIIDIDILLFDDVVASSADLTVPHPLLVERSFVLVPLAELAPEAQHPVLHSTIGDLAADVDLTGLEHIAGPDWVLEARGARGIADDE